MEDKLKLLLIIMFSNVLMQYAAESREIFLFFQIFEIKLANLRNIPYICTVNTIILQ